MHVQVRAMGYLQRRMPGQKAQATVTLSDGATVGELLAGLGPDPSKVLLIKVNGEQSSAEQPLSDGDTVVLYPRISGG